MDECPYWLDFWTNWLVAASVLLLISLLINAVLVTITIRMQREKRMLQRHTVIPRVIEMP